MEEQECIFFLDETLKTTKNPYFCLGGFICTRKEYEEKIIKSISNIKQKHGISFTTPLHYTDIKNSKNGFEFLKKDPQKRTCLMNDIVKLIDSCQITTLGVYFNQVQYQNLFGKRLYDIAFFELLRNYTYYLNSNNLIGSLCLESRSLKENASLQNTYLSYLENGNSYFDSALIKKHITSISFTTKADSCSGLEMADFLPVVFVRHVNGLPDSYALWRAIHDKLYMKSTEFENILGLRNLT